MAHNAKAETSSMRAKVPEFSSIVPAIVWTWIVPIVLLGIAGGITYAWPASGLYVYGVCILIGTIVGIVIARLLNEDSVRKTAIQTATFATAVEGAIGAISGTLDQEAQRKLEAHLPILETSLAKSYLIFGLNVAVASLVGFVVAFSGFLRFWSTHFGGFVTHNTGYWYWLRYGLSWLVGNGLFNVDQIFGWSISDIHPTMLVTRLLVWGCNLLIGLVLVATVIRSVGLYFKFRTGHGKRA